MTIRPTTTVSASRRGFSPLRDLPAAGWLLATVLVAALHPFYDAPRWLLIHLVVLGAVSHSILVWSQHFADTLLHTPVPPAALRRRTLRLALLNLGALLVLVGVVGSIWPCIVLGASGVAYAAAWHAISLVRQVRRALASRFALVVRYYVAAAALLPVGALFGTQLATDRTGVPEQRLVVAHVLVNVLGWVGLTVLGTLVTLWPTMLRTRMADGSERAARRALPVLVGGLLAAVGSAAAGAMTATAAGVAAYLVGIVILGRPFVATLRAKRPSAFPTWSVLASVAWLAGVVGSVAVLVGTAPTWEEAEERLLWVTPALAAGFAGQVLVGALSHLLPVALGGGPSVARATHAAMERGGALRLVLVNGGLLIALLPTGHRLTLIGWGLVLAGLAGFLGLVLDVSRVARTAKAAAATGGATLPPRPEPVRSGSLRRRGPVDRAHPCLRDGGPRRPRRRRVPRSGHRVLHAPPRRDGRADRTDERGDGHRRRHALLARHRRGPRRQPAGPPRAECGRVARPRPHPRDRPDDRPPRPRGERPARRRDRRARPRRLVLRRRPSSDGDGPAHRGHRRRHDVRGRVPRHRVRGRRVRGRRVRGRRVRATRPTTPRRPPTPTGRHTPRPCRHSGPERSID